MSSLQRLGLGTIESLLARRAALAECALCVPEGLAQPQRLSHTGTAQRHPSSCRSQQTAALSLDDEDDEGYPQAAQYQHHRDSWATPPPAFKPPPKPFQRAPPNVPRPPVLPIPWQQPGPQQQAQSASDNSIASVGSDRVQSAFDRALAATSGPIVPYAAGRLEGVYRRDPLQETTIVLLQQLYEQLEGRFCARQLPSGLTLVHNMNSSAATSSAEVDGSWWHKISTLLHGNGGEGAELRTERRSMPKGMYMYGGVGSGKTMLMDLFVDTAPREFKLRRTHYHDFMLEVHSRLQRHAHEADPLTAVANDISRKTKVLCLDELFVTDVADAMILHRLFAKLWDNGLVLVATSNRQPDALYEGGLQRNLFLPFIARLKEACLIHDMASRTDYRRLAHHERGLYFVTPDKNELLHERFVELCNNNPVAMTSLPVAMGRTLHVPAAGGCIAKFDFADLCDKPLGAADYIALTNSYHTVAISNVPVITSANRAAGYRLITLVDVLYEHKTRVLISAEGMPYELFAHVISNAEAHASRNVDDEAVVDDNLAFAKDRTVSRMIEMGSHEYLEAHAQRHAPELLLALQQADKVLAAMSSAA